MSTHIELTIDNEKASVGVWVVAMYQSMTAEQQAEVLAHVRHWNENAKRAEPK